MYLVYLITRPLEERKERGCRFFFLFFFFSACFSSSGGGVLVGWLDLAFFLSSFGLIWSGGGVEGEEDWSMEMDGWMVCEGESWGMKG